MKYDMQLMAERLAHLLRLTDRLDDPAQMEDDGAGFNQPDAVFFRDLYLSPQNIGEVAWRLRKYKSQLKDADLWGEDLESAKAPSTEEAGDIIRITNQFVKDNKLFFSFKTKFGSATFKTTIDWIKSVGGRWDGSSWSLTANTALAHREKLEFWGLNLSKLNQISTAKEEAIAKAFFMKEEGKYLIITHDFDVKMNEFYRAKGGFTWHPATKTRRLYLDQGTYSKGWLAAELLMKEGYLPKDDATQGLVIFLQNKYLEREDVIKAKTDMSVTIPALEGKLKLPLSPYQLAGVNFIQKNNGRCIIGDEMGMGKTAQAIAWCILNEKPALVVCPMKVKVSWEDDIKKFTNKSFQIINNKNDVHEGAFFTVVHYDILWKIDWNKLPFEVFIIDESHYIKEKPKLVKQKKIPGQPPPPEKWSPWRSKAALDISKTVDHVIELSGTPVVNRPRELINQIETCRPGFISESFYLFRFCDPKKIYVSGGETRTSFDGASNLTELFERLEPIYIRRTKKEFLTELPDKIRQDIKFGISFPKELEEAGSVVGMYSRVKKAMAEAKAPDTAEYVEGILETFETGQGLILFTSHPNALAHFEKHFTEKKIPYLTIKAGMTNEEAGEVVRGFQNGPIPLIIVSLECGAEGINLFKASHVVFNDLHWTPGKNDQGEDRAHRRGQKNAVNIYRMIGIEDDPKIFRENEKGKLEPVFFDLYLRDVIMRKSQIQAIINTGKPVPAEQLRYLEMSLDEIASKDGLRFK